MTACVRQCRMVSGLAAGLAAAHRLWVVAAAIVLACFNPTPLIAQSLLHEMFESVISDQQAEPIQAPMRRPIVRQTQWLTPSATDRTWQPQEKPSRSELRWGARLAQAEVLEAELPPAEAPPIESHQSAEGLPPPAVEGTIPLAGSPPVDAVQMSQDENGLITLIVRDASLSQVLAFFAQQQSLNIVAANDIDALISITLYKVPPEEALTAILSVANYTWVQRNNIILVTSLSDPTLAADVQDRQIQVFELDFASAQVVSEAVTNFLSPVGKVSTSASDPADNRKTRELVVVEDLPGYVARIADYIAQVDRPPRQVLIEAHVLEVTLTDETTCGVDLHALCQAGGYDMNFFSFPSFTTGVPGAGDLTPPAVVATFAGNDLQTVINMLQRTTDSKTLGSPKLLVLNGQEARIQVGQTLYYAQTTTTETSSLQGAASVESGTILTITPRITQDGRVMLHVVPEITKPGDRPDPELPPDMSRIELQSDVMLRDGEGMIIGGLIDEVDTTSQRKVPYLGDVKGIGWLFRQSTVNKERREYIFALVPRIQPYDAQWQAYEQGELVRVGVPLLHGQRGPLKRADRPWDPVLPDGKRVYRPLLPRKHGHYGAGYGYEPGSEYVVPPYPLPEQYFYGECDPGATTPMENSFPRPLLSDEAAPPEAPNTGRRFQR